MSLKSFCKPFILLLSYALVSRLTYYYCCKKTKKKLEEVNEVIMFSHGEVYVRKSRYSRSPITPSLERLLYYLNYPRHNLDICMYVFTSIEVGNTIMKLYYRGVKIRLIIDADMAFSNNSFIKKMDKQGIPIRWMKSTNLMHHKFCLMDTSTDNELVTPLVMMGSLNWTTQALFGNWEDIVVTSQADLVKQYIIEFNRLWTLFTPAVD